MAGFRKAEVDRDQIVLWEQRLDDAITQDHEVRLFDQLLHSKPFHQTFVEWESEYDLTDGKPPYHPYYLSALYLYGMLHRLRSSRALEEACRNRLDVIWLMEGQQPDYSTIANFVKKHQARLRRLHKDTLQVALEAGLLSFENVAYDGTKIGADAGKGSTKKQADIAASLEKLKARIAAGEREWEENERREEALWGGADREGESEATLPKGLAALKRKQERLELALQNIQARQEAAKGSKKPKAIVSVTDPDSRTMASKEGGTRPNYNAQLGVESSHRLIVAQGVSAEAEDSAQLVPLVQETQANTGSLPESLSADGNYNTGPNLAELGKLEITAYMPVEKETSGAARSRAGADQAARPVSASPVQSAGAAQPAVTQAGPGPAPEKKEQLPKSAFTYDAEKDVYRCPRGKTLSFVGICKEQKNSGERVCRRYRCSECVGCPLAAQCCKDPAKGRTVKRDQYEECRERHREHMSVPESQEQYKLRKQTVEPCFGYIKGILGVRRFLRRGLEAVRTEWSLICAAVNIQVLLKYWQVVQAALETG